MKLATKLILFISGSKLIIVGLFILVLPFLVREIASEYTNYMLQMQRTEVMRTIQKNGLDYYLQGETDYGSYTMLKEEYIALEQTDHSSIQDTIREAKRVIEGDTLNYRILSYVFTNQGKHYLLEIGKTTASIDHYNKPLQRVTLYALIFLIALTVLVDILFTRILVKPLALIISTKLQNRKFPFRQKPEMIKTSTTDFKYLDESLVLLMQQINEAFEKEREFTANASHEFMTPISILQSKMENLLREETLDEKGTVRVVEMMRTLDRLKRISSSLLLISRIDNEQYTKKDTVPVLPFITDLVQEMAVKLEEKEIKTTITLDSNIQFVQVNADLLFQLFYNMLHNALKFTVDHGEIRIEDTYLTDGNYEIRISDTGKGIEVDQLPFIFDRFKKSNRTGQSGFGLGLAIVKSIATYHDMQIHVYSKINAGTTFVLTWAAANVKKNS
ncbi:hypothetical protein GCM10023231_41930 [Olivibacter ginsenosidimutans]|uniref:histidine kinase n=1 Tax=Olivibacter ginsenosidimutans TaxID=1176537 RepID=A0ABP9CIF8_9SPHI